MAREKENPRLSLLGLTPTQFQNLTDQKAMELLRVIDAQKQRQASHALWALMLGTLGYLAALGACVYLGMHNHPKLAAAALAPPVLTVVKRIMKNRV